MTIKIQPYEKFEDLADLRARMGGSSEAPALFNVGYQDMPSAYSLWARKSGLMPVSSFRDDGRVWLGQRIEPIIAELVTRNHSWELIQSRIYRYDEDARMGATLDYTVLAHPDGPGLVECKNRDYLEWRDHYTETEASERDLIQVAHQMALWPEAQWACIAALVGGNDLRTYIYTRAALAERIEAVRQAWAAFWPLVEKGEAPSLTADDTPAWLKVHERIQPGTTRLEGDAAAAFDQACIDYELLKAQAREAGKRADAARAAILEASEGMEMVRGAHYRAKLKRIQVAAEKAPRPASVRLTIKIEEIEERARDPEAPIEQNILAAG